ncbi:MULTISPECIES: hypothetical protein [Nostocales]|jgi:hypothetical protein|uniref:hypothetical protein n=1 Tax=Nostocales TaxID=1161 RepID=UPI00029B636B|nr:MULTISPECIES: hypothetical protein [Nostocales]MBD1212495.1 hypothetical protein [Dolichospermum circinale Clear-D4]MBO1050844.1 hypothetical protein [Dolichospermum sp. DET73]MCM0588852.1 hypothetical protein [Gloeotrichia echinulata DEX184]OBQ34433.1 MAG: hypothetical protein AN487_18180 [Anabaena sp. CRKS33]QSV54894.1 MAG: hypothetical protein HEP80_14405 [Dolichospermum sp. UKL201]QSV71264.1 MAG: hypothetical protein HEQ20_11455 [Aphanizomenon flos-aquae KM1D3_PB]
MSNYQELLQQAKNLTAEEQLKLVAELISVVRNRVIDKSKKRSILDLEGLGKEIWQGIDAQEYVNQERGKCNG